VQAARSVLADARRFASTAPATVAALAQADRLDAILAALPRQLERPRVDWWAVQTAVSEVRQGAGAIIAEVRRRRGLIS
jgi:hypothetical protein